MKNDYYKAYDKRYRQTYENNSLWEISERTKEVIDTLKKYKITKNSNILELGCGEGRDAIYLLDNGYKVLGVDYSFAVIDKCNELTNYKYVNNFKQLDLIENSLNEKFDFIYSVAVIHMFVLDEHRNKFYNFIYDHLKDNGIALIISMGDGVLEINSDLEKAFDDTKRVNINTNKEIMVASTSCRVKRIDEMKKEIQLNNLEILEEKIIDDVSSFNKCMLFIVKKKMEVKHEDLYDKTW
jgi:cyclopropane fatty-acyl-phospholipid synthase-like methyltransferase